MEQTKTESAAGNITAGSVPATDNPLDRADALLKGMAAENDRREKLLAEEKELMARRALAGRSEAGIPPAAPVKLSDKEYAKKVMRGEANPLKEDGFIR